MRVSKNAKVSVDFEWRYRFDSNTRQVRVGTWPKLSLGDIRRQRDAFKAQVQAKDRKDLIAEKEASKQAQRDQADLVKLKLEAAWRLPNSRFKPTLPRHFARSVAAGGHGAQFISFQLQGSLLCFGLASGLVTANAVGLGAGVTHMIVTATGDFDLASAQGTS